MGQELYFITTLQVDGDEIVDTRCVGSFEEYEDAKRTVCRNVYDIHEGIYNYAVIEAIKGGLYQVDLNPKWFQAYESDGKILYHEVERPAFAKHSVGFGIG